jgi:hypothetical protein
MQLLNRTLIVFECIMGFPHINRPKPKQRC